MAARSPSPGDKKNSGKPARPNKDNSAKKLSDKLRALEAQGNKNALATKTKNFVRIVIHYDCGFNNHFYIRGRGGNLSWDKGLKLKNISRDEWAFETAEPFHQLEFKVLLNDKQYETGPNHVLNPGASLRYTPHF